MGMKFSTKPDRAPLDEQRELFVTVVGLFDERIRLTELSPISPDDAARLARISKTTDAAFRALSRVGDHLAQEHFSTAGHSATIDGESSIRLARAEHVLIWYENILPVLRATKKAYTEALRKRSAKYAKNRSTGLLGGRLDLMMQSTAFSGLGDGERQLAKKEFATAATKLLRPGRRASPSAVAKQAIATLLKLSLPDVANLIRFGRNYSRTRVVQNTET